jgi:hypothetical protein
LEHFEKLALDSAQHKPLLWCWYVDDTFVVCSHGPELLQNFLSHFSSLSPSIQFTMEIDSVIPFLDVLVIRKEMTLAIKVFRKPTRTGRYLNFKSNHLPCVKSGLIQSLHSRASTTICQEQQDMFDEISSLRHLQPNGYAHGFIDSVINSESSSHLNKEERPLGSVDIPYVKVVSGKFSV